MWITVGIMVAFGLVAIMVLIDVCAPHCERRATPTTDAEWREHIFRQYRDRE